MDEPETCYLPLEEGWIRLLRLPLGDNAQKQSATFERVQLSEAPEYVALSYVWGDSAEWEFFNVDGFTIPISPNLSYFLYFFLQCPPIQKRLGLLVDTDNAQDEKYVRLWIDALCINQDDIGERNSQVRFMKQIYEKTVQVIVWLGPIITADEDEDGDEQSLDAIRQVRAAWSWFTRLTDARKPVSEIWALLRKPQLTEEDLLGLGEELVQPARWEALGRFLVQRKWWQRIWTVQEASTPAPKEAMCGNAIQPLLAFSIANQLYQWLRRAGKIEISVEADLGFDLVSDRGRADMAHGDKRLVDSLTMMRRNKATDPRDKVYATLGHTEEISAEDMAVDYALPVASVYLNAAKYILKTTPDLDWLDSSINSRIESLPSWVTDWSVERKSVPIFKMLENGTAPVYQATGTAPELSVFFAPKEDLGKLNLKAVYVDRLAHVSQSNDTEQMATETWIESLLQQLEAPYPLAGSGSSGSDESIFQALLRTFLLDCYWEGFGLPVSRGVKINGGSVQQYKNISPADFLQSATRAPSLSSPDLYVALTNVLGGRRLAVTEKGFIGIVDDAAEPGDHVALLIGCKVLHILRPCVLPESEAAPRSTQALFLPAVPENEYGDLCFHTLLSKGEMETMHHTLSEGPCVLCTDEACQTYQLVGEAYVHGLMDGEALQLPGTGGIRHITVV